tara:strand:+ start:818 stop:1270 length:453 start_codon:yes stop_codon:yes gene_type:complete
MAVTATPVFTQTPQMRAACLLSTTGAFTFAANSSTTTNLVSLYGAGTNGSTIESIMVSSTDTSARDLILLIMISSVLYPITTLSIPATAGFTNAIAPIDLFRNAQVPGLSFDVNGNRQLILPASSQLYVGTLVGVTAAKQISVLAMGGDF